MAALIDLGAADEAAIIPEAAAAATPSDCTRPLKAMEVQARIHAAALRLQSIPKEENPERKGWHPLDATGLHVLHEAGLQEQYEVELVRAQSSRLSD